MKHKNKSKFYKIKYIFQNFAKPDRIKQEGYPVEEHEVVTDDGYILTLFRIPFGKKSPRTEKPRPPVLLTHALLGTICTEQFAILAVNFAE